ncbi:hypothetical protein TNCV_764051 [Trichonephila clavipes]|nr:hypothetical protein TNCV_764051 [Trichonephila clavipes]
MLWLHPPSSHLLQLIISPFAFHKLSLKQLYFLKEDMSFISRDKSTLRVAAKIRERLQQQQEKDSNSSQEKDSNSSRRKTPTVAESSAKICFFKA